MNEDTAIYFATYAIPATCDARTAAWLEQQQGDGPLELTDVTDVCASCSVEATLRNIHGMIVGYVDSKGDYRLV